MVCDARRFSGRERNPRLKLAVFFMELRFETGTAL
jgi:hypothetical protein